MEKRFVIADRKSLKVKITIWYALFMVALTVSFLFLLWMISNQNTEESIQNRLIQTVQTVGSQIDGTKRIDLKKLLDRTIDKQTIAIYSDRGDLIAGGEPARLETLNGFEEGMVQSVIADGSIYYVYDQKVASEEDYLWVRGYVRMATTREVQQKLIYMGFALLPILTIIMMVGGYLLTKRALRPLDHMIQETSAIVSADDLDKRIPIMESGDELAALGTSMNRMLEKLEESFQREKQFTSDVSHELRTPVAVIMAQCEAAKTDFDGELLRNGFAVVERQARRMRNLIEELLQLSRMESGKIKPELEDTNLSLLLDELIQEQKIIYPNEDMIEEKIQKNIIVSCDRMLVERALRNLIINAHQYGGGAYKIGLNTYGQNIIFSIKDHGGGISAEDATKIWNRFYRGDKSRQYQGGYGLGLPMVKHIIALHGWEIHMESEGHRGAAFYIVIPIKKRLNCNQD